MNFAEKTCLVTGANTGLGLAVAKKLAAQGADTVMVCRTITKAEEAAAEVIRHAPDASVTPMACELSSIRSVRSLIEELNRKRSKLDILYNNAAAMKQTRTVTADGLEMMFQVNYLAPFMLMTSLAGLLGRGSSPCVVNNGRPSYKVRLDMDDLQLTQNYSMYNSFFVTKLCLLFATLEFSRRHVHDGIAATMIDPGPFKSELVRDVPLMNWAKNLFSAPVERAADNLLCHIGGENTTNVNGKVYKERREWPLSDYWKDTTVAGQLWSATEAIIEASSAN